MSVEKVVVEHCKAYTMKPSKMLADGSQHVVHREDRTYQQP